MSDLKTIEKKAASYLDASEKAALKKIRDRITSKLTPEERKITDNSGYVIW